jgi:hypothetical protein
VCAPRLERSAMSSLCLCRRSSRKASPPACVCAPSRAWCHVLSLPVPEEQPQSQPTSVCMRPAPSAAPCPLSVCAGGAAAKPALQRVYAPRLERGVMSSLCLCRRSSRKASPPACVCAPPRAQRHVLSLPVPAEQLQSQPTSVCMRPAPSVAPCPLSARAGGAAAKPAHQRVCAPRLERGAMSSLCLCRRSSRKASPPTCVCAPPRARRHVLSLPVPEEQPQSQPTNVCKNSGPESSLSLHSTSSDKSLRPAHPWAWKGKEPESSRQRRAGAKPSPAGHAAVPVAVRTMYSCTTVRLAAVLQCTLPAGQLISGTGSTSTLGVPGVHVHATGRRPAAPRPWTRMQRWQRTRS